ERRGGARHLPRGETSLLMQPARQRIVRGGEVDHAKRRRRRERDEIGGVVVVREHERLRRLELLADAAQLVRREERAGARADGAHAWEGTLSDAARQLLSEVERIGPWRDHRRAATAERGGPLRIGRDRVERLETRGVRVSDE